MATKSTKKSLVAKERVISTELRPRDDDYKYWGAEPLFATQPDEDKRGLALIMALNWYNRFYDNKESKKFLITYAEQVGFNDSSKQLAKVEEREIMPTLGWLARLYLRGLNLTTEEQLRLTNELNRLVQSVSKPSIIKSKMVVEKTEVPVNNRPNVQEIMKERTREVAGEIEGWLDDFIKSGAKAASIDANSIGILTERNILPQHISILTEIWKNKTKEFEEVYKGSDSQLTEAYSNFTKTQLKAVIKFCEAVLAGLNSYVSVKKATQAPRKRKPVSAEKQVSKFKYQKAEESLKLVSVHPSKIINATEMWAYDVSKRKLHYYVADSHIGSFGIKGTTILGFDATKSGIKTLRKPAEILKKLMSAGKPASRKVFEEVSSVQTISAGRSNDSLIILKVY
jgi:hypothetical protein